MKPATSWMNRPGVGVLCGALLVAISAAALHEFTLGSGLVRLSYDLLLVARSHQPADAVLVFLDDKSHEVLNQPFNAPWDRAVHARLIERLAAAGARAIAFDIVFSGPSPENPAADERLAQAMRRQGNVILAADHVMTGPDTSEMSMPYAPFREAAAGVGSAEVVPDRDMVVRVHTPETLLPSLSWAAAEVLEAPVTRDPSLRDRPRWVNYYGPADHLRSVSYHAALDPAQTPDEVFRDKVVFVGARLLTRFSGERKDEYLTPFSFWGSEHLFISGVEVQATAFLNLWRGDWLTRTPFVWERWVLILGGLVLGGGLTRMRPLPAVWVALGGAALTALAAYGVFHQQRVWMPWLLLVVLLALGAAYSVVFNSVQLYVQKRLYEQTLSFYLSPKLVRKFLRGSQFLERGAEKQVLTILFSDIAGFTSVSEGMDSDTLAEMMNQYFERAVGSCIHRTDGTVGKYIGDGMLAFWNAPDRQEDHAWRACEASLWFRRSEGEPILGRILQTRIGIHTGVANVGNFGSSQRVDYTVLGENVNLASRLEGLNKYLGTRVLITEETRQAAGDRALVRPVGRFRLKGFQRRVDAYELLGDRQAGDPLPAWADTFRSGLEEFYAGHLPEAAAAFQRTLDLCPEDGPAKFYLEHVQTLATLPPGWQGEMTMTEK